MQRLFAISIILLVTATQAGPVVSQGDWATTLKPRDLTGDGRADAFYDTELDLTWLRNANVNGFMNWSVANAWAAAFTIGPYSDWRLPTMVDTFASPATSADGCNWSYFGGTDCGTNVQTAISEMAHLSYVSLGNKSVCPPGDTLGPLPPDNCSGGPQPGWGQTNTGDFENMQHVYWFGTTYAPDSGSAWAFDLNVGDQTFNPKDRTFHAMAVHDSDIGTPIPEPGTVALLALGLAEVGWSRRKRSR